MVVDKYGQTERTSVNFDKDMPIRYKLERDNYSLIAETDLDAIRPGLIFYIGGETQDAVRIHGEFASTCFGNFSPMLNTVINKDPNRLYFTWMRNRDRKCIDTPEPDEVARILVISMLDVSGAVIGVEEIPFTIIKNGIHIEYYG
jgi:hypothetical protein